MTYFLEDYLSCLIQNQAEPNRGHDDMAGYIASEVFQGAAMSAKVQVFVDTILSENSPVGLNDLKSWSNLETRERLGIPHGIQTIHTLALKLKLPVEKRSPEDVWGHIISIRKQAAVAMA